jgi:hypothetical protein
VIAIPPQKSRLKSQHFTWLQKVDNLITNHQSLFELSNQFIHSPIIIATTEPPSRITQRVFPVISCSTYCRTIAPSIVQRQHPTNRREPRAPRSGFDAPRWMTARGSGGSVSRRSPEARPESTIRSGNEPHRSRGRRSDGDFCPSHRDDGNRTLNEELAVMICLVSTEKSVVMRYQIYKEEYGVNVE